MFRAGKGGEAGVDAEFGVTDQGELDLGLAPGAADVRLADAADVDVLPGDGGWDDWVDRGWEPGDTWTDPDTGPDDDEAWLAGLPAEVRAEFLAGPFTGAGEGVPAGFIHRGQRDGGPCGAGFAAGGALDTLAPGPWLAGALAAATGTGFPAAAAGASAGTPAAAGTPGAAGTAAAAAAAGTAGIAGTAGDAAAAGGSLDHRGLGESELVGVLCGWRRLASWAAAGEAAAVGELAARRRVQAGAPGWSRLADHVGDEVAAALTLTGRSATRLLDVAAGLGRLPAVHAALERGDIDWAKAAVFADELAPLDDGLLARAVAGRYLDRAGGWTTGQLRAALRRAVLAADPQAAARRQQQGRKDAQVSAWEEASGNAGLAGRELPPAEVLAADARLTALAKWLQRAGAAGTISQLRAAAYTALLTGRPLTSLLDHPATPDAAGDAPADDEPDSGASPGRASGSSSDDDATAGDGPDRGGLTSGAAAADAAAVMTDAGAGAGWPAVTGTIHLTMPLTAFDGGGQPGEVAGHGPVDAATARLLARWLARTPQSRWCLTLTGPGGRPAAHACAAAGPAAGQPALAWAAGLRGKLQFLESGRCGHSRQAPGYVPPAALRHLIGVRQPRCGHPGCRRPAARCDLDHTIAWEQGGRTCECNLAPLCRRHHQAKQAPRWHLDQPEPGQMTWRTPSGRSYQTTGDPY